MPKFTIQEPLDFELVSKKLVQVMVKRPKMQAPMHLLLMKIFMAGFELGKHGKSEIET